MSGPNLLTLPREIRSIIYSNLSNSIALDWGWRKLPFPLDSYELVRVSRPEAPIPSVLLSCRQIYHEYSQERQFRKPVFLACLHERPRPSPMGTPTNQERTQQMLSRADKVEFMVQRIPQTDLSPEIVWQRVKSLTKAIQALAPGLERIGITVRSSSSGLPAHYISRTMGSSNSASTGLELPAFVARLRAHVQQEYDDRRPHRSASTAYCKPPGVKDTAVGEWSLGRAKDGVTDAISVE